MKTLSIVAAAALAASGIAAVGAGAAPTTATSVAKRHVEGRVVAINSSARTFTVRDAERGTLKVKVTSTTRFQRITGFSALRKGQRVDVRAKKAGSSWRATIVERGARPTHAGGADDPANHDAGDDKGGARRGGADDPVGHR
jgi:hypothetical protein